MILPQQLKYTKDHEWVKVQDDVAYIGITDFAQRELGDIVYVDIDASDKQVGREEVFGTVEAVKTVSDLFCPLSGKVMEVNPLLESSPELVNSDPYGEGWMIKLSVDDPSEIDQLLSAEQYAELIGV
jgi:glycine cleavage system H protein